MDINLIAISAAVSACEKGSQWEKALGLFAEFRAHNDPGVQKSQGDICDIVVYSAVISSCSKCARWQTALGLLQDFERSAAQAQAQAAQAANAQTYNAAMLACVTGHAWRTAAALALQMQLQQVETDVIASCTLVGAFVAGTQPVQTAACMDLLHHRALAAMPA